LAQKSPHKPLEENQRTEEEERREKSVGQKRARDPPQGTNSSKRGRRDLETAIKRCLVAGLFMNAARFALCPPLVDHDQAMCQ
jgi:hypothetical protein